MNRQAGDRVAPLLWHGLGTTQCPTEVALAAAPFLLFLGEDNQVSSSPLNLHLTFSGMPCWTAWNLCTRLHPLVMAPFFGQHWNRVVEPRRSDFGCHKGTCSRRVYE
jgi:hypothetical protein